MAPPPDLRADQPLSGRRSSPAAPPPPKPERRRRRRVRAGGVFARIVHFLVLVAVMAGVGGALAGYVVYRQVAADLPDYRWLADYQPPQMSRIYAADSRLLAELAAERRIFVPIEAIPRRVSQAFISAEDQRFREHRGVDPIGIGRAIVTNLEQYGSGRRPGGASTITQQVAKNMLVGADRTLARKAREAILAFRIEQALSKDRILEIYLNEIYLGSQAYGVAAAAQTYFNKGLDELTPAETAFLAALPKAPNNYNPARFPEAARARRDWVLDRMAEDGAVSADEAAAGKAEPISARPARRTDAIAVGQHFTEEVRRELIARFGQDQTVMGGFVVRSSLDPALQAATETALRNGLLAYDRRRGGWRGPLAKVSAGATEWMPELMAAQRPGGAPSEWRLAVALEVRPREARLGWVERPDPRGAPQPRGGTVFLEDVAWARRSLGEGRLGGAPQRMADVLSPGDVVMVEVLPATAAAAGPPNRPARPERLALRQIPAVEGAVVALDPTTGRVQAMAGGWSFDKSQFNRTTQALRQPGSTFKPFVYISALEQGIPPNQRFLDGPIEINTPQGVWRPGNYSGGASNAYVTMRAALEKSLNLVTIRVAQEVGMDKVADAAARFGVIPNMPKYLAMSLGSGETTVLRMAAGYAAFVNGGREVTPTLIDSVQDQRGRVVWRSDPRDCGGGCGASANPNSGPPELTEERKQVTDPIAAYQMVNILTGVVQRGTGTRAGQGLNRPVAGKTGTTNDYMDNWFVGFTPDLVVAVWLGFDEPKTLGNGETGGQNAAPIFRDVMEAALRGSPPVPFRAPPGVALVRVQDGGASITEAFRPGTENAARPPDEGLPSAQLGVERALPGLY